MKFYTLLLILLMFEAGVSAQNEPADYGRISLLVVQPEYEHIPSEANEYLEDRIRRIVINHGLADNGLSERFVITAKVYTTSRVIVPTTPSRISLNMEVSLYVGDVVENKIYGTTTISTAGIGTNNTKAFIAAFQQIPTDTPDIKNFMQTTKERIAAYYSQTAPLIFAEAERLSKNRQYDEAIYKLLSIPNICADIYKNAQTLAHQIYTQKIDDDGETLLRQARSIWNLCNDHSNAIRAMNLLMQINVSATCRPRADDLISEIDTKLRAIEQREWEFAMQQYEDELAMRKQKQADKTALWNTAIVAIQNIGVAFGKNRPQNIDKTQIIKSW